MLNKRAFKMKITKSRLKQIISEELARLDEIDNAQVQIQTAQSMMDDANRSGDTNIQEEILALISKLGESIQKLSDPSMKGAMAAQLDSFKTIFDNVQQDIEDREEALSNNEF
jgi:hypothetical protein